MTTHGEVASNRLDTSIVRGLAALLIINSHAESLYPHRWMADGGQLGISIFFFVAGMGTWLSESTRTVPFGTWYLTRLARIYPSIWIVVGCAILLGIEGADRWGFVDYLRAMVYPVSGYTFFAQIIPFYVIGYVLVRLNSSVGLAQVLWGLGILSVLAAVPDAVRLYPGERLEIGHLGALFWWCCYLALFVFGMLYAATRSNEAGAMRLSLTLFVGTTILYVALKYMMVVRGELAFAFVLLWAIVALWTVSLVDCLRDPRLSRRITALPILGSGIVLVGSLSLETFLVHGMALKAGLVAPLAFPLNIGALLLITIALAWPISAFTDHIRGLPILRGERRRRADTE